MTGRTFPPEETALARRILYGVSNVNGWVTATDADAWDKLEAEKGEDYKERLISAAERLEG